MTFRIVNWDDHFENNRSRDVQVLNWVPVPNKLDGDGYTELIDHPDGASIYGAWVACVLVASKCDPRGTLLRAGNKDHDSASLSRITRIKAKWFDLMFERTLSIGWIETYDNPALGCGETAGACTEEKGMEGNGTEGKEQKDLVISKGNDGQEGIPSAQEFFDRWNAFAKTKPALKTATKLTEARRSKINTRLKDLDWWISFLAAVQLLPLVGEGWQPDLNWMIANADNVYLILEGKYDWRSDSQSSRKLRERREKVAADFREQRLQEHKEQCKKESAGTRKAIDDILSPSNGNNGEPKESSLLFGSDDDSSASGADHQS